MPKYQVIENRLAIAIIHIDAYLMILRLIEKELQRLDIDNNERIKLRLAYIEF